MIDNRNLRIGSAPFGVWVIFYHTTDCRERQRKQVFPNHQKIRTTKIFSKGGNDMKNNKASPAVERILAALADVPEEAQPYVADMVSAAVAIAAVLGGGRHRRSE
jgi:hypothetical protein